MKERGKRKKVRERNKENNIPYQTKLKIAYKTTHTHTH